MTPTEAVIICTRNRPDDLRRTLESVSQQEGVGCLGVLVVDGSDAPCRQQNEALIDGFSGLSFSHCPYPGDPAGTRQRNYGIERLPASVEIVHFIDDDVTLQPGYLQQLSGFLRAHPAAGGVGGCIVEEGASSRRSSLLKRIFALSSEAPARVLASGHATPARCNPPTEPYRAQWLSTCASSYRREVFTRVRFDPEAEGASPRLEDLDFSFRVGRSYPLFVEPRAGLIHHRSHQNRRSVSQRKAEALLRRYWFIEKNAPSALSKPAFWWAVAGQMAAVATSSHSDRGAALRGLLQGARRIVRRDHPLL